MKTTQLTALILLLWAICQTTVSAQEIDPNFYTYKNRADDCFTKKDYPCADKWYRASLAVKADDDYCKQRLAKTRQLAKQPKPVAPKPRPEPVVITDPFADQMVYVSGGSFDMGSDEGYDSEKPVHRVRVSSFYMGQYEVTQAQWRAVMGNSPSYFKYCDNCPVEQVSWNDIQEFLTKLNARTGKNYRLPTEAEWEYAAGGGATNRTRFGNGKNILDPDEANFDGSASYKTAYSVVGTYRAKTTPVGSFSPNALGLYDMSGNVWEWCADWYKGYPGSSGVSDTNSNRVLRGGSWGDDPQNSRVAFRNFINPSSRNYGIGVRLVFTQ
jgi:formylglycine-generating enzyme required for sulfatase activity